MSTERDQSQQSKVVYAVMRRQGQRENVAVLYDNEDSARACCRFRNDIAPDDVEYQWRVLQVQQEFRP